ncbi:Gfo/Idh/MocA family oxidoreductase [uncultured Endozoicomonas sp.]|uniref:Gfo/Idh/MocA family protein n=1 Tax=uncultured Endozoicomonas sp. TaxID=432652 RepID=UPI0026250BF8|nr:Gfo/Idh/MocA family oxidoreductase [uncultured Endozoicomonas sp.]
MITLAVIGTNWISNKFVDAALQSERFSLQAVYSRSIDSAKTFASSLQSSDCLYFDDLQALAEEPLVQTVYIASPNSLHCEQACLMMQHGKHVICEKPIASNVHEAKKMYQVARDNGVILLEAFKTEFLPNFIALKRHLADVGRLRHVFLSYCQYSSRYQKYLDGENPNTFNPSFSNGSIMDIGYYCVAAAISLFGKPDSVSASACLLDSGVDAQGSVLLNYPDFIVTIQHSKVSDGLISSEIQGEGGSIILPLFSECPGFDVVKRGCPATTHSVEQAANSMLYEAQAFARQIDESNMPEEMIQRSLSVAEVITEIRRQTGVVFPSDN